MMRIRILSAFAVALVAVRASSAEARFARVDIEKVPVDRLVKNLEGILQKDPKDAKTLLNLARAHAMAYSLRAEELEVVSKSPDGIWFGYLPPLVPFRSVKPTNDPERLRTAKAHLEAALHLYEDLLKLTPDDRTARLGRAWLLTQTDHRSDAVPELRKIVEEAWKEEKDLSSLNLSGHSFVAEAGGYLIPLLDPDKDKAEIATLRERVQRLGSLPRPITPIAIPLRAGLTAGDLENRAARVRFDADGTGFRKEWSWTTPDAAWLVHDPQGTGEITSGLQLFGSVTFWLFWDSGYDALAALDDDHDGQLTGKELDGLALWNDANGNGICEPGEVRTLSELGIVAISCAREPLPGHPDGILHSPKGVTFRDGTTRPTYDFVLHSR